MAEYDSSIALATRLIKKKGEACTLRHYTPGVSNPTQPWRPTQPSPDHADITFFGAWIPLTSANTPPIKYEDGTMSKVGDSQVYMDATVEPQLGDEFVRTSGAIWKVKKVAPLDPGGRVVIYTVWVAQL